MTASIRPAAPSSPPAPPSGYAELPPGPALAPYVECFWVREPRRDAGASPAPLTHRILPDGCMDLVLGFDSGMSDGGMVVGTMTRALVVPSHGAESFFGVRFRPGMAAALLRMPAHELTDQRAPLDVIWPRAVELVERVAEEDDIAVRVRLLERAIVVRLRASGASPRRDVAAAVRRITLSGGTLPIADLVESLGVTRQHLARVFGEHVGVSPKTFARVVRLARVIARARSAPTVSWSALAYELGYYDQAHLVGEFRALAGVTPAQWAAADRLESVPFLQDVGGGG